VWRGVTQGGAALALGLGLVAPLVLWKARREMEFHGDVDIVSWGLGLVAPLVLWKARREMEFHGDVDIVSWGLGLVALLVLWNWPRVRAMNFAWCLRVDTDLW
jgi:hypothetical protein